MRHIYNKVRSIALVTFIGMALGSCSDFLNITPRNMVTEDNFWNEKSDIDQYVAGIYAAMQSESFITRCIVWGEVRSDNIYPGSTLQNSNYDLYQVLRENLLSTSPYTSWVNFYYVINKCNSIISRAPEVSQKDPSYRESDVKATIAEVTALRALSYFYLIRAFENVPFYREAVQQEDEVVVLPPTGFDTVLAEIVKDLERVKGDALDHYPTTSSDDIGLNYNSNCNRITRSAINAMLCDMYLWQGEWQKAINVADEIIAVKQQDYKEKFGSRTSMLVTGPQIGDAAPYGTTMPLYANTAGNPSSSFDAIFGDGNSFESIFELSFNYTSSSTSYVMSTALGRLFGAGITIKTDGLDPNDGAGLLAVNPTIVSDITGGSFAYFRHKNDARFYTSFQAVDKTFGEGYIRKGVASNITLSQESDVKEVNYSSYQTSAFSIPANMNRNWIFYRLTDVMLMKAEALTRLVSDSASSEQDVEYLHQAFDLAWLVQHRSLAALTVDPNNDLRYAGYGNRANMLTLIREERNRELMFEGKRWFDLVRQARLEGTPNFVRSNVTAKVSGSGLGNLFPNMESLFWPYNKDELKVDTLIHQKATYAKEADNTLEMN